MKPHSPYNAKQRMLQYLEGRLSHREQNRYERHLMSDPFEAEAIEGLSKLTPDELANDLAQLEASIDFRKKRKTASVVWRIAAIVLMILVPATVLWLLVTQTQPESAQIAQNKTIENKPLHDTDRVVTLSSPKKELKKDERADITSAQTIAKEEKEEVKADDETIQKTSVAEITDEIMVMAEESPSSSDMVAGYTQPEAPTSSARGAAKTVAPQNQKFVGKITDETGEPIIGATITVEGTSKGTVTDVDGNFVLQIPQNEKEATIETSFIGYETAQTDLKPDTTNFITLKPQLLALDEVVVVGYGTEKKRELTSAVSSIEVKRDEEAVAPTIIAPKPAIGLSKYEKLISAKVVTPINNTSKDETVVLKLFIDANGKIDRIEIIKSPNDDYSTSAIDAVKQGPIWLPGTENGKSVYSSRKVRISFKAK